MNNPRLAGRYAKSLLDLAIEHSQLDAVYADMKLLQSMCKTNPDFVAVLKSPVINSEKKDKIIDAVIIGNVASLTAQFIKLLIRKARENNLPEIADTFIDQYNELKDIHKVEITTAVPMSRELEETILSKIKANTAIQNIELERKVEESLIGGFTLKIGGSLVDASVLRDLNDVKKQFKSNEYIHRLR